MEKFKPLEFEPEILGFWDKNDILHKARDKNKGKKKFYFCDGPPYTSGKVHLGTAWNKSLKDSLLRFKRMSGFDVWDRAGYDMHGLPTEQGVEKLHGLKFKGDIEKFGVKRFIEECRKFAVDNLKVMNEDFTRLGVWMDFENAYQTRKNEWIEGEWWLIKKAHENKRLYEGEKTMHWCARCGTALAKHELEYKDISENSIFVKLRVREKDNEFLIIWTTTPWTIPFNLGVMVNPNLDYVKAKVEDEIWIIAKGLAPAILQSVVDKKYEIIEEFKGDKLEGIKYDHPFSDTITQFKELEQKHPKVHSVVLSEEYVDLSAGSGLVHMAPGCGPEDYEVGHRNNIPPFNTLSESGIFEDMGEFSGLTAKKDDKAFIEALDKRGALIAKTKIEHDYAHCWRCKEPIIYKTTTQWFFRIEDLKDKMRELNKEIKWIPDSAGSKNYDNWIANLRDNGITRQRYWGTPLPIWKCNGCDNYKVIGSVQELKENAINEVPDDLHKPWIDEVKLKCACGSEMARIPDVLDVWIDSGSASWNCIYYPKRDDLFKEMYPADFILEGIDQIRGWFNLLFVSSMVSMEKKAFKSVYMHGFVNDSKGRKMSKSLGNYILPAEVINEYGADTFRYYSIGGTNAGVDLNYNFEDLKVKHKNLNVLWNLHNYVIDLAKSHNINPEELKFNKEDFSIEEQFIFSKLNSTIKKVTEFYERYEINKVPELIEGLFLELSRTYIQLIRDKAALGSDKDKKIVIYTIYKVIKETIKLFTTIAPFVSEKIYLNLKKEFNLKEESVSLCDWPDYDHHLINEELESEMDIISNVIQNILYLREKVQLGVRWPLKEAIVITRDKRTTEAVENLKEIIIKQANVKEIQVQEKLEGVKTSVKADFGKLGPDFGDKSPKIIAELTKTSPETILKNIEKHEKHEIMIDNEKINIVKEHLIVNRIVPESFVEGTLREGFVYINKDLDNTLEAEGYSRELMRRVQALRKKSGLNKSDKIELFVKADQILQEMFYEHKTLIKEKVGATEFNIGEEPAKQYEYYSKEKVKGKEFELFLEKI